MDRLGPPQNTKLDIAFCLVYKEGVGSNCHSQREVGCISRLKGSEVQEISDLSCSSLEILMLGFEILFFPNQEPD